MLVCIWSNVIPKQQTFPNPTMIKIRNVTKYYPMKGGGKHYVLRNVTLDIPSHQSIGVIGPNGAGKSTLLRMIGGAEAPNAGKIETNSSISWPLGLAVGFQGSLTGRQNVLFVCQINGLNKAEIQASIAAIITFAELGEYFDMPVKSYSSGMRARLGFGLSINFDFNYYLIDELTSVGDAAFRAKAAKEFERIKRSSSLIYVAHNLNSLKQSCESALFLRDGEVTYYEDIKDGIRAYNEYIWVKNGRPKKKAAVKKVAAKKVAAKKVAAKKVAAKKYIVDNKTDTNNLP